jgi:hypothetical protein
MRPCRLIGVKIANIAVMAERVLGVELHRLMVHVRDGAGNQEGRDRGIGAVDVADYRMATAECIRGL